MEEKNITKVKFNKSPFFENEWAITCFVLIQRDHRDTSNITGYFQCYWLLYTI